MPRSKRKQSAARKAPTQVPPTCMVPDCGRRAYDARGLCQTHHRQLITTGKLKPIRPYRGRSPGTVKFSGLRLSEKAVREIDREAAREGLAHGAVIAKILEEWSRDGTT